MARSEAPASAKAVGNSYPLRLPPPRQSSTLQIVEDREQLGVLCRRQIALRLVLPTPLRGMTASAEAIDDDLLAADSPARSQRASEAVRRAICGVEQPRHAAVPLDPRPHVRRHPPGHLKDAVVVLAQGPREDRFVVRDPVPKRA